MNKDISWKIVSKDCKSIAIVGNTGAGKTAMIYNILASFDKRIYWFRHPRKELLDEHGFKQLYSLSDLESLEECAVVIDEPQLYITTYEKKANTILLRILSLCRQRGITLILSTSDTRFITRGIESYIDIWIIKDLYFDLVKQGSIIRKIVKDSSFIDYEGLTLKVEEYIFFSRIWRDFNGKHTFVQPAYFDERHSRPYSTTAKESPKETANNKLILNYLG